MEHRASVLLVDNDVVVRSLMAKALRQTEYVVREAADGQQALAFAQQRSDPIDLLVTDIVMPRIDGFELARRLGTVRGPTRTLFIAGDGGDDAIRSGLSRTRHPLLLKPFTQEDLLRNVREALASEPAIDRAVPADLECRGCGSTLVEIIGLLAGIRDSDWRLCHACGHVWAVTSEPDVFPLLVGNPAAVSYPLLERRPPAGVTRANRFRVQLTACYRVAGEREWQRARSENVSRTGILLRTPGRVETLGSATERLVELQLDVRASAGGAAGVRIRGCGRAVRNVPPTLADAYAGLAVAVQSYRVDPGDVSRRCSGT